MAPVPSLRPMTMPPANEPFAFQSPKMLSIFKVPTLPLPIPIVVDGVFGWMVSIPEVWNVPSKDIVSAVNVMLLDDEVTLDPTFCPKLAALRSHPLVKTRAELYVPEEVRRVPGSILGWSLRVYCCRRSSRFRH